MLDVHLAEIYGVETRVLKQAVRRNSDLFPEDFMFVLSEEEIELIVSQNAVASRQSIGGSSPYAFTETGVAMLSGILKSKRAKEINIAIMRAFVALRKMLLSNIELGREIERIKEVVLKHDKSLKHVFHHLDQLTGKKEKTKPRKPIGYKTSQKK